MAITLEIIPRDPFREFIETQKRWMTLVVHRRGGKTVAAIQRLIRCAMTHERRGMRTSPLRYGYIAPTRDQAKDIAWAYLKDFTAQIPGVTANESDLKIVFPNRAQIRLYSGENYDRMRGLYFDGIVSDEDDDIPHQAFAFVILPCLLDHDGWHCRMGTPKGKGSLFRSLEESNSDPDHYSLLLKASESGILSDDTLTAIRQKIGEAAYNQEMQCDFDVARPGAIYGEYLSKIMLAGQICNYPIAKEPIMTFWDLGISDSTSIWFVQLVGQEIRIVDWYENTRQKIAHYGQYVKRWCDDNDHQVDVNYLPHDGNSLQLATGQSLADSIRDMGLEVEALTRPKDKWTAIDKIREMFPRMWFRKDQCSKRWHDGIRMRLSGIECLESYRMRPDEPGKLASKEPIHDEASHSADALRTFAEAVLQGRIANSSGYSERVARDASPVIMGSRGRTITRY